MRPTIHPCLCLEFTHQKTGVCFNEKYHSDDVTRQASDVCINSALCSWASRLFVDMVERPDIAHGLLDAVRDSYYRVMVIDRWLPRAQTCGAYPR